MRFGYWTAVLLIICSGIRGAFAAQCLRPDERVAFGIAALKSEMMVVALSCHHEDRYNAAITRFRPQLLAADRMVTKWLSHYGNGTFLHDRYITDLANAQSISIIKSGDDFCDNQESLFDAVMAISKPSGLSAYVLANPAVQPSAIPDCRSAAAKPPVT